MQSSVSDTISHLYENFYQIDLFSMQDRIDFEYDFFSKLAPAIEIWLVYPEYLTSEDKMILARVDAFLNFLDMQCILPVHVQKSCRSKIKPQYLITGLIP